MVMLKPRNNQVKESIVNEDKENILLQKKKDRSIWMFPVFAL